MSQDSYYWLQNITPEQVLQEEIEAYTNRIELCEKELEWLRVARAKKVRGQLEWLRVAKSKRTCGGAQ